MDDLLMEMPMLYCFNCGGKLGRLDNDSRGGFICRKCKSEFDVIRHDKTMTVRVIWKEKKNKAAG